jgi:hypothetical protein
MDHLVAFVSATLAAHDPLDSWLTESNYDEHHWDREARKIARQLVPGMSASVVRGIVTNALGDLLGTSADGAAGLREQSRRVDLIAAAIAENLR